MGPGQVRHDLYLMRHDSSQASCCLIVLRSCMTQYGEGGKDLGACPSASKPVQIFKEWLSVQRQEVKQLGVS